MSPLLTAWGSERSHKISEMISQGLRNLTDTEVYQGFECISEAMPVSSLSYTLLSQHTPGTRQQQCLQNHLAENALQNNNTYYLW